MSSSPMRLTTQPLRPSTIRPSSANRGSTIFFAGSSPRREQSSTQPEMSAKRTAGDFGPTPVFDTGDGINFGGRFFLPLMARPFGHSGIFPVLRILLRIDCGEAHGYTQPLAVVRFA